MEIMIQFWGSFYRNILYKYTVSKNDTGVAHYKFYGHQPILVIFGRYIA